MPDTPSAMVTAWAWRVRGCVAGHGSEDALGHRLAGKAEHLEASVDCTRTLLSFRELPVCSSDRPNAKANRTGVG